MDIASRETARKEYKQLKSPEDIQDAITRYHITVRNDVLTGILGLMEKDAIEVYIDPNNPHRLYLGLAEGVDDLQVVLWEKG